MLRSALRFVTLAALCLFSTGCVRDLMVDAQLRAIRDASEHSATMHDFELASASGRAGISQLEGLYALAPDNTDALFMLTRGWAGLTFAFTLDDYELAKIAGDDQLAEYHLARARAGFRRARFFGVKLLEQRADGFAEAKRNGDALEAWLEDEFTDPEDAEELLWVAFAWLSHGTAASNDPEVVAELYVGLGLLQRSLELSDDAVNGTGHMIMGAILARPVGGDLKEAKKHFERAVAITGGRYLTPKLLMATRYHCAAGERAAYEDTLRQIVEAGDTMPERRVMNVIAKRRARRYLSHEMFRTSCAFSPDDTTSEHLARND